jgi:hypothetical protein
MRNFYAILTAAALLSGSAMAAGTDASLAPGKPAGLRTAQERDNTFIYIVGLGAVAAGIALVASDSDNGHNNNPPTTTPSTQ